MQKIDVIEYLPQIMRELKKGILVNTKNGDKTNSMTIAWGQVGIEWRKLFFTTYIRHGRFTHEQIENTKEFNWMKNNAHKFGFILRYPKANFHITGFKYEPWHYRYVGIDIATYIYENNITLEEYKLNTR